MSLTDKEVLRTQYKQSAADKRSVTIKAGISLKVLYTRFVVF